MFSETIQAQGCMENLAENLRSKCSSDDVDALNECHKCNGNLCNKWAANSFQCIQCDSATVSSHASLLEECFLNLDYSIQDSNCINNAEILDPTRCPISRTPNQYCYTAKDGNRLVRGCTSSLEQQKTCMSSEECVICDPGELSACNNMRADGGDNPVTPTPNPNPSAGAVIDLSVANYVIALFAAYICKYL